MGCGVWGVGCGVWGVGCGVWGVRCGVWGVGFGFWVSGSEPGPGTNRRSRHPPPGPLSLAVSLSFPGCVGVCVSRSLPPSVCVSLSLLPSVCVSLSLLSSLFQTWPWHESTVMTTPLGPRGGCQGVENACQNVRSFKPQAGTDGFRLWMPNLALARIDGHDIHPPDLLYVFLSASLCVCVSLSLPPCVCVCLSFHLCV